ncbi:tigger transposable element-derived protein 4-like [Hydractinia symbiolongicarpus]|uniref:tigger transposable element-derived protein 4-like n=1 Tax=Hydractinia symbiolongicarpus TaxID=13093 RepID=UPI00254C6EE1|nr:tigger transposable element-derived protein 4-like [Hydractinia symbiolongicarpus]
MNRRQKKTQVFQFLWINQVDANVLDINASVVSRLIFPDKLGLKILLIRVLQALLLIRMINDASSKPFERLFRTFSRKSKEFQKKDTLITMSSVAGSKRRIDNKSYKIKYKALKALEKGTAPKDVAKEFKIPPSTLSTWKKNKEKIYKQFNNGQTSKRSKPEKFEDVNKAVHKWLLMMRSENIPISGPMLKEKALEFAEALGVESFQASQGWMAKWKTSHNYRDQCLPNKPLHMKGDKCSGGKHSKVRLTGLAAGNALGKRLPMFVIGKSANPRCFKGVKTLPCRYRSQKKSWMSGELFEEWVRELDRKFSVSKRKIALIIDNCTAHPHVENLEWVELIFLPPNTTSQTQPMDQGIIRALKAKYRSLAVRKLIKALDEEKSTPKFSILAAMYMLRKAWDDVSNKTFTNCFRKSGISQKDAERAINEDDDPFKSLTSEVEEDPIPTLDAELSYIKRRFPDHIDPDLSTEDFIDFDIEVSTSHGRLKTADIIAEITGTQYEELEEVDEEDKEEEDKITRPTAEQVRTAINVLEDLSIFSHFGEEMIASLRDLNRNIAKDFDMSSLTRMNNNTTFYDVVKSFLVCVVAEYLPEEIVSFYYSQLKTFRDVKRHQILSGMERPVFDS